MKQSLQVKFSKTLVLFALCFFFFNSSVFSQNFVWAKSWGASTYESFYAQTVDGGNNIIGVGTFSGTIDFDPGIGVANLTSTAGGDDIFIVKLTSAGTFVWARRIGTTTDEYATDITVDNSNNLYIVGAYRGTVDFDPGAGTANLVSAGNQDCFMLKLNSAGNYVWAKSMGGVSNDNMSAIDIDAANTALYVTGTFTGTADFNPGAGTNTLVVHGSQDAFVGKYDLNGNYVWAVSLGGASTDYGYDLAVNSTGSIVYCTGVFYGSNVNLTPGCSCTTYTSAGQGDVYVVKLVTSSGGYNSLGVIGGNSYDNCQSIELDAADNVYLSGQFSTLCDFNPGAGINTLATMGSSDAYVCKWTWPASTPTFQWVQHIGGLNTQSAPGMVLDPIGNIYVTGQFDDVVDFDPSSTGTYTMQALGSNQDVFVLKWDNNANFIWAKKFGSNNIGDSSSDIDLDSQGNVYTIGNYFGSVDFDPGVGTFSMTSVGATDAFMQKLSCTLPASVSTTASNYTICASTATSTPLTLTSASVEAGTTYGWSVAGATGVSFSPTTGTTTTMSYTSSTTFSIIVTATNACGTSTSSVNKITVNPLPTVGATATPTAVCSGSLLTLSGTGASTYTWNGSISNNVAFTPTGTAVYTVTGTDVNGCVKAGTISVTSINNPTLSINGTALICLNKPQTLTASGASSYTWMPGSVVNATVSATPTVNSVYTVNATAANGCNNFATFSVNLVTPPTPDICQVTVDSLGVNNEIYWDKALYPSADSFIVYREVSTNLYKRIAAQHKSVFSMYVDTNRTIGPANGDPNLSYYRYKLQLRDSCGNYSALSLWHETIFVQDQQNGNFNWSLYAIESSTTPVSNYNLKRRSLSTGTETLVASVVFGNSTDPLYNLVYMNNLKWFVDAVGFNCNPTAKVAVFKTKTKSNQSNDRSAIGIKEFGLSGSVRVYPNPAADVLNLDMTALPKQDTRVEISNALGQVVYETNSWNQHLVINTQSFGGGVYFVNIKQDNKVIAVKKVVIQK